MKRYDILVAMRVHCSRAKLCIALYILFEKNTVRVSLVQERALFQKIRTKRCCCMSRGEGSIPFQYFYCYLKRREKGSDVIDRQLGGGAELVQGVRRGGKGGPAGPPIFRINENKCSFNKHTIYRAVL